MDKGGKKTKKLEELKFDNLVLRALPIDKDKRNIPRSPVPEACFSIVDPTPIKEPILVSASLDALSIVDIDAGEVKRADFPEYFCGNKILPGARPAAHCYCGHQFGYFSGQLGDGATMYLGEIINSKGERWEIQFKGAGKTPYSRTADGRKVLRSSIREFLCSEAMAGLGIPTTRAPTCITSEKSTVIRDVFYDGNPEAEQCTVITRLAKSFLRFGSFEIVKEEDPVTKRSGPSAGNKKVLMALLEHTIKTYYPSIWESMADNANDATSTYLRFYKQVVVNTAQLVASWQCVGWCHGVLNTDNMSILGITIDYGPYDGRGGDEDGRKKIKYNTGFMERTDKDYICNGSDNDGRYTYGKQPAMCRWNCEKLAEAIQMAVPLEVSKKVLEETWDATYKSAYYGKMKLKLGLGEDIVCTARNHQCNISRSAKIKEMKKKKKKTKKAPIVQESSADFTISFRLLSGFVRALSQEISGTSSSEKSTTEAFLEAMIKETLTPYEEILESMKPRMAMNQIQMLVMMARQQPFMLQRFPHLMSDLRKLKQLDEFQKISEEKRAESNREKWSSWLGKYRSRILQIVAAESKKYDGNVFSRIASSMDSHNPKYILRNYMLQDAISRAETHDYSGVEALLQLVRDPYAQEPAKNIKDLMSKEVLEKYRKRAPKEIIPIAALKALCTNLVNRTHGIGLSER
eukprot:jgi/Bigna1/77232/fgenesh1_pg.46_\